MIDTLMRWHKLIVGLLLNLKSGILFYFVYATFPGNFLFIGTLLYEEKGK